VTKIVTKTGRTFYCGSMNKRINLWRREIGHGRSTVAGNTKETKMTQQRDCPAKPISDFDEDCSTGSGDGGREDDTPRSAANDAVFAARCVACRVSDRRRFAVSPVQHRGGHRVAHLLIMLRYALKIDSVKLLDCC